MGIDHRAWPKALRHDLRLNASGRCTSRPDFLVVSSSMKAITDQGDEDNGGLELRLRLIKDSTPGPYARLCRLLREG